MHISDISPRSMAVAMRVRGASRDQNCSRSFKDSDSTSAECSQAGSVMAGDML